MEQNDGRTETILEGKKGGRHREETKVKRSRVIVNKNRRNYTGG